MQLTLSSETKVLELIKAHPFIEDYLITLSPKFRALKNPVMRATVAKFATLNDAAGMAKLPVPELLQKISQRINNYDPENEAAEKRSKKAALREIIQDLHQKPGAVQDEKIEAAKARFRELVKTVDAAEIAELEQGLIADGISETEITKLCDVHVKVMEEGISRESIPELPVGHPVPTFMRENRSAKEICAAIDEAFKAQEEPSEKLRPLLLKLAEIDKHYLRKENQLFPMLEKHGITGPSRVMWALDDEIRKQIKDAARTTSKGHRPEYEPLVRTAVQAVRDMIFKEENILFPMSLSTLSPEDWQRVRNGEEELGYSWISAPGAEQIQNSPAKTVEGDLPAGLQVDTGVLTLEQIRLIFTHLPVDLSFVNENDEVLFYSGQKERVFPRSPGVIGRKVQNCHPGKSVHIVNEILDEFRKGNRNSSEFWIQFHERFLHIRYFAVRDVAGTYKGCLEVTQDVTEIRKLEGERRILDWR